MDHNRQLCEVFAKETHGRRTAHLIFALGQYQRELAAEVVSVLQRAVDRPCEWNVKRMVDETGLSRSTLERRLSSCALPVAAQLLRSARVALALDSMEAGNCSDAAIAKMCGWSDERALRRALRGREDGDPNELVGK